LDNFPKDIDVLVLGCTHYPIYLKYFKQITEIDIIDPSFESISKLKNYFIKHKGIYNSITKNSKIIIHQTGKIKIMKL